MLLAALACCSPPAHRSPQSDRGERPAEASAATSRWRQFIGQPATPRAWRAHACAPRARESSAGSPMGGMVTMDFSPDRLTVQLDGANRVNRRSCG